MVFSETRYLKKRKKEYGKFLRLKNRNEKDFVPFQWHPLDIQYFVNEQYFYSKNLSRIVLSTFLSFFFFFCFYFLEMGFSFFFFFLSSYEDLNFILVSGSLVNHKIFISYEFDIFLCMYVEY